MRNMREKIISLGIIICFISLIIPEGVLADGNENHVDTSDYFTLSHVIVKGTGRCITLHGAFFLGFGRCWAMFINLEEDGYVEISSLLDSNNITLEGNYRLIIVGFMGFKMNVPKININGFALFTSWS